MPFLRLLRRHFAELAEGVCSSTPQPLRRFYLIVCAVDYRHLFCFFTPPLIFHVLPLSRSRLFIVIRRLITKSHQRCPRAPSLDVTCKRVSRCHFQVSATLHCHQPPTVCPSLDAAPPRRFCFTLAFQCLRQRCTDQRRRASAPFHFSLRLSPGFTRRRYCRHVYQPSDFSLATAGYAMPDYTSRDVCYARPRALFVCRSPRPAISIGEHTPYTPHVRRRAPLRFARFHAAPCLPLRPRRRFACRELAAAPAATPR